MTALVRRIVGTAGHIDHGKTALVRALTGVDCDRLPEEKRRGITIDLGFANMRRGDLQIGFVDVPGHERFVRNMLAGVGGIDSVVLVVAADESVMPQTREHFAICRLLRIPTGIVAITKSDLVDLDMVEIVRLEIKEMVRGSFLEGCPILPVSATTGRGVDELGDALVESVRRSPERDAAGRVFRLPIDRAFTMKGFGSVVTGTTISGTLETETEVEILPGGARSRARGIQVHGEPRERAVAGERTSVNLADLPLDKLARGQQITMPGTLRESSIVTAELELLPDAPPLRIPSHVRFHHFSAEVIATVRVVGANRKAIEPGEKSWVQLRLESPIAAVAGDRFVIRRYSPAITIGGGVILDAHLPKLSAGTRDAILSVLGSERFAERVEQLVRLAGLGGLTIVELRTRTGFEVDEIARRLASDPSANLERVGENPVRWLHRDHVVAFRHRVMETLEEYFDANRMTVGYPKSQFMQTLLPRGVEPSVAEWLLGDLAREKIAVVQGDVVDVPGRSKNLGGREGELAAAITKRFAEAGLQSLPVSELIQTIPQKPKVIEGVVAFLVKTGMLVRLAEGIYVHRDAIGKATETMQAHRGETIDVAWFKECFGLSRKVAIPLLEHFDRTGVTRRIGDRRAIL